MKSGADRSSFKPWVFVDTQFVRRNETLVSMAFMEKYRRIALPAEICDMERGEQIEYLRQVVFAHQKTLSDGNVLLWGTPMKYLCHIEPCLALEISPAGAFLRDIHGDVANGGASLTVGGRFIAGVDNQ